MFCENQKICRCCLFSQRLNYTNMTKRFWWYIKLWTIFLKNLLLNSFRAFRDELVFSEKPLNIHKICSYFTNRMNWKPRNSLMLINQLRRGIRFLFRLQTWIFSIVFANNRISYLVSLTHIIVQRRMWKVLSNFRVSQFNIISLDICNIKRIGFHEN